MATWKIRPKDAFFVGLDQFSRLKDICLLLSQCIEDLKAHKGHFEDEKVIMGLYLKIKEFIETKKDTLKELEIVKKYLAEIKIILDNNGNSAEEALKELATWCKKLGKLQFRKDCGLVEAQVIKDLLKFVETKGTQLFNYIQIEGAPRTNNSHELTFKQLKHFLRRIIGFHTKNITFYLLGINLFLSSQRKVLRVFWRYLKA